MNTNESTVSTGATYTTQMDAARKGIITPEMKIVAQKEKMTEEELRELVACGKVVIPANKNHKSLNPEGVGSMLRTKINVNLGVSRDCKDYDVEMEKVMAAVNLGAESIMDLSSHGNTQPFRQKLTAECPAMIGTVPVYDSVIHYQRDLNTLTAKDFLDVVELHAKDGVDFVTLHCGITRKTIDQIKKHKRKMNIVSRGGSLVFAWMSMTGEENPFYEYYDEILDICEKYDVTISLGDACRPGCLADATDVCQIEELVRLGELTKRAWEHNVQVIVEGPGHVPLDQVAANMQVPKRVTSSFFPTIPAAIISANPWMLVSGVFSSCETFAKNSCRICSCSERLCKSSFNSLFAVFNSEMVFSKRSDKAFILLPSTPISSSRLSL